MKKSSRRLAVGLESLEMNWNGEEPTWRSSRSVLRPYLLHVMDTIKRASTCDLGWNANGIWLPHYVGIRSKDGY